MGATSGTRAGVRLFVCVGAAVALITACAPARAPIDWQTLQHEGRAADEAKLDRLLDVQDYYFSDGEAELRYERTWAVVLEVPQLFVDATSSAGRPATFIVDTGASGTLISSASSLAREARISRRDRFKTKGYEVAGYLGYLPSLRIGPLVGPELAVGVTEQGHLRHAPSNILGIVHLFHTQLEHRNGRWTLRSGRRRLPAAEPGWTRVPLVRGTQLVQLTGPDGKTVYGMIDTGATDSFVVPPAPEGEYRLLAEDGRVALTVPADDDVDWADFMMGGYRVDVAIGMDVLSGREWRLTFDQSTWALAPAR